MRHINEKWTVKEEGGGREPGIKVLSGGGGEKAKFGGWGKYLTNGGKIRWERKQNAREEESNKSKDIRFILLALRNGVIEI